MRFLIAVPTYNRPDLLLEAVDSVLSQDYQNWRIIVSDNQSEIPAETALGERLKDPRIRVVRLPEHLSGTEHGRRICQMILNDNEEYDYVSILADDDYMVPGALSHLAAHPSLAQFVVGGIGYYYQKTGDVEATADRFNGETIRIDARKSVVANAYYAGVAVPGEPKCTLSELPDSHVSFIFLHRNLFVNLDEHFGGFLIDPFGDVGLGRVCKFIDSIDYIPRPIGIIRFFNNYGQIADRDRRQLLSHHKAKFVFSPLKHVSFANCAAESYFTVLSDIGIHNAEPTPSFFLRHLREILHDKPKDLETLRALWEAIFVILRSGYFVKIMSFAVSRALTSSDVPKRNVIAKNCRNMDDAARALIGHHVRTKA